jgi:hypothetical protein
MPRITANQTNFTAGEISPRVAFGRVDIDKYANAAKVLVNAHPTIHGGAVRRAGTFFGAAAKFAAKKSILIPFVVNRDLAYMLELGDFYMRVYQPNGVFTGVEVASPYTEAQLADVDWVQGADVMYLYHPNVFPQRVRRFAVNLWDLSAVPYLVTPFDEQGHALAANLTLSAVSGASVTVTASAGVFLASDVGRNLISGPGIAQVTAFTSATQLTVKVLVPFTSTSLALAAWYLDVSPQSSITPSAKDPVGATITLDSGAIGTWRAEDVGKYVRLNGGMVVITVFNTNTNVSARVIQALTATVASPALAWSLEASVWSAANGYPRTGTLHEQRVWAAGSPKYPQTVWGSRTGIALDFTKGANDSDACIFTIQSDESNPISYLAAARNLLVHTFGGEFSMKGGNEKPITPSNVQVKPESKHGSKGVRPLTVGKESLYVQRAGRKVRAMGYHLDVDGFVSSDLTILAEHITASGVTSMTYQQEPYQLLWLTLGDGTLISCTLDRDQNVNGWARHYTDGAFEWVATIPNGNTEQVWAIVRRFVNGAVVRYLEWFDETFAPALPGAAPGSSAFPPYAQAVIYGNTVDAGISVDNAAGQTVFTGLSHLEGKTVDVVADGSVMPQQVVTGGQITLSRASFRTLIGLHFRTEIGVLTPELGTGLGSAQGNSMRTGEITLRLINTLGGSIVNPEGRVQDLASFRFGTGVLDKTPAPFTGNVRMENLGWERGRDEFSIVQDQPLPMYVASVIRKFTVND